MTTIIILLASILAGYLLRDRQIKLPSGAAVSCIVWTLLFLFGISIGSNRSIVAEIDRFGLTAVVLAALTTVGSAAAALLLTKLTRRRDHER